MPTMRVVWACLASLATAATTPDAGPFSLTLRPSYRLAWEIRGGILNATMSSNASSWIGFGLSPTPFLKFHGMNHADIVVASWNGTGTSCTVRDYFNPSDFEGAPKLDVDIGGTDDILSFGCAAAAGSGGWSSASWSRRLTTADTAHDWPVADDASTGYAHVIIAHGQKGERALAYHGFGSTGTCKLRLWNGTLVEPCKVFWT